MDELISVIVPVYNVESYLARCLDSILNSTYKNLEVICINDGSTDGSLSILQQYALDDSRIQVINQKNKGLAGARNTGLSVAKGKWVSFVDSDDWIHPQNLEIFSKYAEDADADIAIGKLLRIKEYEEPQLIDLNNLGYKSIDVDTVYKVRYMRSFVCGKLYKRSILAGHLFDTTAPYAEDSLYNVQIYCETVNPKIISVDAELYYYFDREGSLIHQIDNRYRIDLASIYLKTAVSTKNELMRKVCILQGFKRLLVARYTETYSKGNKNIIADCSRLLHKHVKYLLGTKSVSIKEKVAYTLFAYSPFLYRSWRIKDDPTMKEWERAVKDISK